MSSTKNIKEKVVKKI